MRCSRNCGRFGLSLNFAHRNQLARKRDVLPAHSKTGGQTLARRIASAFPPKREYLQTNQFTYPHDYNAFSEYLDAYDFVEGHVTGQMLNGRQISDLLVTVREPVAQIMSNYRHIRREPDRRLSRAAREMTPAAFFDHFGDFFTDFQSRYLLSAFIPLCIEEQRDGLWGCAAYHLPRILKQIRWLVPTDQIDAFVPLWESETGRRAAENAYATNHAPHDGVDLAVLEAVIRARPALFALDNVLYQSLSVALPIGLVTFKNSSRRGNSRQRQPCVPHRRCRRLAATGMARFRSNTLWSCKLGWPQHPQ